MGSGPQIHGVQVQPMLLPGLESQKDTWIMHAIEIALKLLNEHGKIILEKQVKSII